MHVFVETYIVHVLRTLHSQHITRRVAIHFRCGSAGCGGQIIVMPAGCVPPKLVDVRVAAHVVDVLRALGVNVELQAGRAEQCLNAVGVGFLFAPFFHPAMKYAAKSRADLGVRTIFNLLGPITNPAGVRKQLVGTFHTDVASRLASALQQLSTHKACVVHSHDGMDEVAVSGETTVFEVEQTMDTRTYSVSPEHFGLPGHPQASIAGGTAEENAAIALKILNREQGPHRDVVIANAAFGIYVAGRAPDLAQGSAMAAESIDSGNALHKLKRMVEYTNRP